MAIQKIFPSAQYGLIDADSRVFYEHNVTNLISQLVDRDIFVISYANNILKFNIKGYYVEYETSSSTADVWVNNNLTINSGNSGNPELVVTKDNENPPVFGISITEDETAVTSNHYQLLIDGNINPEYQIKFNAESLTLPNIIDCGTINN